MKLYNALTQQVEPFEPQGETATVYVCGITPYDTTHLGHAFTYTSFDVLIRALERRGYPVRYVQNVTDIDDDILRKAKEVGGAWDEIGKRWTVHFIEDMRTLNVRPPDHFPAATGVIPDIIDVVQGLVEAGVAYESGGSVYYNVDAWSEFGKLSRIPRAEMLAVANERGNHPDDPHKRDPLDFVLWQAAAPGEPTWDSPWGPGRPGWHIECSTMSSRFLEQTIDIHGGGADLIFPHHECEIAQAEPLLDDDAVFTRFWMHTAMVYHDGEKMSKSLGNLVMARDLLKEWSADSLRLYMGRHHYRDSWEFDEAKLKQAEGIIQTCKAALSAASGQEQPLDATEAERTFDAALDDDLDTPTAATAMADFAGEILAASEAGRDVGQAQAVLRSMGTVFGLRLLAEGPEERVVSGWSEHLQRFVR